MDIGRLGRLPFGSMAAPQVRDWFEEQLSLLRPRFPRWDLWYVPHYLGPGAWCARPKGTPVATLNSFEIQEFLEELKAQDDELAASR